MPELGARPAGRSEVAARRAFDRSAVSVAQARMFVAAVLEEGGVLARSVVEPALLAVSELATNAVQHAGTGFEVVVDTASTLRITVMDDSARLPQLGWVEPWAERGRGVALVDATADRWGIVRDTHTEGKAVWWEVDLPTA